MPTSLKLSAFFWGGSTFSKIGTYEETHVQSWNLFFDAIECDVYGGVISNHKACCSSKLYYITSYTISNWSSYDVDEYMNHVLPCFHLPTLPLAYSPLPFMLMCLCMLLLFFIFCPSIFSATSGAPIDSTTGLTCRSWATPSALHVTWITSSPRGWRCD